MKYFVIILLVFSFFLLNAEQVVIRFDHVTPEIVRTFNNSEYDVAAYKPGDFLDLVIQESELDQFKAAGYNVHITQTESQLRANLQAEGDLDGYQDYDELLAELQQMEIDHPSLCQLFDIGESRGKQYSDAGNSNYDNYYHEIWALKVSDNVQVEEDEPSIYYLAEHHAREPISLEVTMNILRHILDNYGTDPEITENVDNTQIWFVPLVNPNGHKVVTEEINTMWRKNICDNDEDGNLDVTGYYANDGVDPNRNYGYMWGGASSNWSSETYQGPIYFSEPETQAVKELVESHHFVAGLSYHSYAELILYPYGYADGIMAPDQAALQELAVDMASTIPGQYGGFYDAVPAWDLYPCTGTTDDWVYGTQGVFGFTIELATEFIPPASQVQGICDDNLQAGLVLLDRPSHSILKGHITDSSTGDPIVAEIFIDGVDNTGEYRYPYESNAEFGSYYRLLTDGQYDVTYSCYGYEYQTVEDVVISDAGPTIVDIALIEANPDNSLAGIVTDADTGLPLENAVVEIQDYSIASVVTNSNGEYQIDGLYEFNYDVIVYKNGFAAYSEKVLVTETITNADFDLNQLDDGTFESGEFGACWMFEGNSNWQIDNSEVYEGQYSARTGYIGNEQFTALTLAVYLENDDEISFYRKVSSETDYDYLKFYVDDQLQDEWSGNMNWDQETYAVSAGYHEFKWSYVKDQAVTGGSDCAWIDNVMLPNSALLVNPLLLEFLTIDDCIDGLSFTINNVSADDVVVTDIAQFGSVFSWFIDDFNLNLPYTLSANEELEFLVKIGLPVDPVETILTDYLDIVTSAGQKTVTLQFDDTLLVDTEDNLPVFKTEFYGNYPNPFNPSTTFKFSLQKHANVNLSIYNIKGQLVREIINDDYQAGMHTINWNGKDANGKSATSGIYFSRMDIRLDDGDYTSVKKVILLK